MSKEIKILTPRIYEHNDFFHNAVDFAKEHSLNTNELCLELSHYLVNNFEKIWKVEKPRVYKRLADLEAKIEEKEKENKQLIKALNGEIFINYKIPMENAQLKQKLAEMTEKYNACQEARKQEIEFSQQDKRELKQQLTDKIQKYQLLDDNYTRLTEKYDLLESRHELLIEENLKLEHQLAEKNEAHMEAMQNALNDFLELRQELNQEKILFAVEQLEKAKSLLFDAPYEFDSEEWCWVEEQLDNQIKQLKEGK